MTGSHAIKTGIQVEELVVNQDRVVHGDVTYAFLRGVPNTITQYGTPYLQKDRATDLGLFVQDQWTVKRLTLNYGLRFDYFNGHTPSQSAPAGRFLPAREFAAVHDVPSWTDLNPRLGASYDLFGNGKTAFKVSIGRYLEALGVAAVTTLNNPIMTSVNSVNRTWNDVNGNYVPDCDLLNPGANGECGPFDNVNFGRNNPGATTYADDVLHGFGVRNYTWDVSLEVQHQIHPRVSLTGGYYRNWAANFRVNDNSAIGPADYTQYCITAPVDPRLPGGGGYPVCGLYDVAPAKFGQGNNIVNRASQYFGDNSNANCGTNAADVALQAANGGLCGVSDFFSIRANTRFGSGFQLGGGVDTGRTVIDNCFVVDSPQQLLHCRIVTPFKAQTQVKVFGSYPLPGAFAVSATFQNTPGQAITANYAAPNAAILPSLGRNLAACGTRVQCTSTATVPLVAPQTLFLDDHTRLDLRLSKTLRLSSGASLQLNFDVYNALNANTILSVNNTYGPTWLQPAVPPVPGGDAVLPARRLQFGGQLKF